MLGPDAVGQSTERTEERTRCWYDATANDNTAFEHKTFIANRNVFVLRSNLTAGTQIRNHGREFAEFDSVNGTGNHEPRFNGPFCQREFDGRQQFGAVASEYDDGHTARVDHAKECCIVECLPAEHRSK